MKGKHHIIVETKKIKYEFDVKRNITVIRGDSATGKTTLIELLSQYARFSERTGIRVESDVPCLVYADGLVSWQESLSATKDSIVFIDEDFDFIKTKEFASVIKGSSNYYVLITRDYLKNLPYSINEVYGIRNSGRFNYPQQIYNEFYPLYAECQQEESRSKYLIIEDSKSGYQFFSSAIQDKQCISTNGNSNIYNAILKLDIKDMAYVIADGAAFGAFIDRVLQLKEEGYNLGFYLPESFEWLVLKAGVVDVANVAQVLQSPEEYIESSIYFSWERFFTDFLEKESNGTIAEYHKDKISDFYLEGKNKDKILDCMPKDIIE